ncbi:MAG: helix-turn-helix domain-containing protein [Pseudonocardia sp.]
MKDHTCDLRRVGDVAAALNVSPATVYRAIESGALRAIKLGKALRIPQDAVDEYLRAGELAARAPRNGGTGAELSSAARGENPPAAASGATS